MTSALPIAESDSGGIFRRILVGFDGSAEARHALRVATALAADLNGSVRALLVVRPPAHAETPEERSLATEAELENLSKGLSSVDSESGRALQVSTEVVYADDPASAIASYAQEHGFDLVVAGTHGREQTTHRGIGQSLESLLRNHPCPVLVV
ncbi:MAG: universal stress protein [Actinobacteria bacterium]|jgi:nucleotide-binding universal stress UspA family protein|nr:universal stress protein [Actinomycetota bacterium]MCL5444941.1 universal stress protein [Actinomycetota bacterium]